MFVGHSFFKHNLSKYFSCGLTVCWRLAVSPWFAGGNSAVIRCHHEGTFAPRMRNELKETRAPTLSHALIWAIVYFSVGLQYSSQFWHAELIYLFITSANEVMKPAYIWK